MTGTKPANPEQQLFSGKEIKAGLVKLNTLMSNKESLDIYSKFARNDDNFSSYYTKAHGPSSSLNKSTSSMDTTEPNEKKENTEQSDEMETIEEKELPPKKLKAAAISNLIL